MLTRTLKPKVCRHCKAKYQPMSSTAKACSVPCALALASLARSKADKAVATVERRKDKAKREKLKTKGEWTREAQAAFNAFIRARDAGLPCICCGRQSAGGVHGGDWDAGHYRSRGSAPHLRFDERNVHAQLKQCNRFASGNVVGYRVGLVERIGPVAVEALEADQAPRHLSIDDLADIKRSYAAKARALLKQIELERA